MITHYSNLLHQTWFGLAVGGRIPWLGPVFETLHFVGMALLVGCAGVIDLRLLGVGRNLPLAPLRQLLPWGVLGFVINVMTGIGFYAGNPAQYQTWAFAAKMLFVVLAGVNAMWFYLSPLGREADRIGPGEDAPPAAKLAAAMSLLLWLGVIFWGRMLPAFSNTF